MKAPNSLLMLCIFLLASFAAAGLGRVTTDFGVDNWYLTLAKPSWTPPAWVFGPVWTTLYMAMAMAAWLVWRRMGWCSALWWWTVQLVLNALWSPVFFGMQRPDLAFVLILALWVAIAGTTVMFWHISLAAGVLFLPYWFWVSFAAALNFAIWRLNAG